MAKIIRDINLDLTVQKHVKPEVVYVPVDVRDSDVVIDIDPESGNLSPSKAKPVNIGEVVEKARDAFNRGITKPLEWRKKQLKSLLRMYEENYNVMIEVLQKDLRRSKTEAVLLEVEYLINDLKNTIHYLEEWAKPDRVSYSNYRYKEN
ncbi:unnamed protein product [Pieris macdunnoughi]|uniref:Uncharacterized protein n=1 Tax=Pieris macdunnoughi TaxID=345717 RepID=A0A821PN52_9NEOP|nr:unnamed protein product [Pieris macdunnoughi]